VEINCQKVEHTNKFYSKYYLYCVVKFNLKALDSYGVDVSDFSSTLANLQNLEVPLSENDLLSEEN